jgi:hypothetical protein
MNLYYIAFGLSLSAVLYLIIRRPDLDELYEDARRNRMRVLNQRGDADV